MSFFKNLFNPSAKPDGEPKRRVWPQQHLGTDIPQSPEGFLNAGMVYSRVFELKGDDQERYKRRFIYMAARHRGKTFGRDAWSVSKYVFDSEEAGTLREVETADHETSETVLRRMLGFEKALQSRGNLPVTGTTQNYTLFASQNSQYVNRINVLITIDPALPLTGNVTLPRPIADRFYSVVGTCDAPLSTWEGFYARYVDILDQPAFASGIDTLRQNVAYEMLIEKAQEKLNHLNKAKNYFQKDAKLGRAIVSTMTMPVLNSDKYFVYDYLLHVSAAVGLLRAGAWAIAHLPDTQDGALNTAKIALLTAIRDRLEGVLQRDLSLQPAECRQICDIMLKGDDPRGPALPIDSFYKKYSALPAAPAEKATPPAQAPKPPEPPVPPQLPHGF